MVELDSKEIRLKVGHSNRHRLNWLLGIFLFVHLAHIVAFWPPFASATSRDRWRGEVILVHAGWLVFIVVVSPAKLLLERYGRRGRRLLDLIPELVFAVYLLGGTALAIVDQQVTPSIHPLLIAALGLPLVIVVRPIVALCQYILILVLFLVGVGWVQQDPDLLLTIRVNSISAISLGFGLAMLQWRNQIRSLHQQHRITEQQRELEAKNQELTILATRDSLTGLLNRAQFNLEVDREIGSMQGTERKACLVMADLDHFKSINDTYGHPVGDRILIEMAGVLTRMLRSTDIIARMGGEEFAILMPGIPVKEGGEVAERVRAAISVQPFVVGGESIKTTASFGVAELQAGLTDGLAQSYRAADLALYQAKNDGRNCVRSFDPGASLRHAAISSQPADIA